MKKETIEVKVGQVWEDCDPRMSKRRIKVLEIANYRATCEILGRNTIWDRKKKTVIRLDRFRPTSTGYKLVSN